MHKIVRKLKDDKVRSVCTCGWKSDLFVTTDAQARVMARQREKDHLHKQKIRVEYEK